MSTPRNGPHSDTMDGWMRRQEKATMHEQRRPMVRKASDLLGPGFGPHAIPLADWNAEEATFNGFFYSEPGAQHAPDLDNIWLGMVISTTTGHGLQQVWSHSAAGDAAPLRFARHFHTHGAETTAYSAWFAG